MEGQPAEGGAPDERPTPALRTEAEGAAVGARQAPAAPPELSRYPVAVAPGLELTISSDPSNAWGYCVGNSLWSSAEPLLEYLSRPAVRSALAGSRILELGAGLGAVGMGAALLGAAEVVLTDVEQMQRLLIHNIDTNFTHKGSDGPRVRAAVLDWAQPLPADCAPPWDFILASDVAYKPDLYEPLWDTLAGVASAGTRVIMALPAREEDEETTLGAFFSFAAGRFTQEVVAKKQPEPHQSVVHVFELRRTAV